MGPEQLQEGPKPPGQGKQNIQELREMETSPLMPLERPKMTLPELLT